MTRKFGVSFPDGVADRVEAPLEYGDKRSPRIAALVEVGLEVEHVLREHQLDGRIDGQERRALVRQALANELDREGDVIRRNADRDADGRDRDE